MEQVHSEVTQRRSSRQPKAIVVGSGFGGLAAAVRLLAKGYQVELLERLPDLGGRARVFHQDGFAFDAGPTVVTAPFLFEELWQLLGEHMPDKVPLLPVDPFYRIRLANGHWFHYNGDPVAMRREVAAIAPEDLAGYERVVAESERIFRIGFEQLAHRPFDQLTDMLRIVPDMVRLGSFRSVYAMVSRHVRNPHLRQILSFHPLLVGGNPLTTSSIYSLILFLERRYGVHFAKGGTAALVAGLADLIQRHGGAIRTSSAVTRLLHKGRKITGVRLASGEERFADLVVCNSDIAWTYKYLLPEQQRHVWSDRKIASKSYSMSLFVWYFGTNRQYNDVAHHSILLGPRYQGLLDDIFKHKRLAEDFSLYLHRPTATCPELAPAGCDAFYVLSPVPHLESGVDWTTQAEPYRQAIAKALDKMCLPGLEQAVVTSKVFTPIDFEQELWSWQGSAFGMAPVLQQSAYFRPHNRSEEFANLYFVGASTHPGAGMPGVLSSAKVLDSLVPTASTYLQELQDGA